MPAYQRQAIAARGAGFDIPGGRRVGDLPTADQFPGQQRHNRVKTQQARRFTLDRPVAPLPLRFHAQMSPCFLKRHLNGPPPSEPGYHLGRLVIRLGAEEGPRLPPPGRVANDHLADRERHLTGLVPQRRPAGQLQQANRAVRPGNLGRFPGNCRVAQHPMQLGQSQSDFPGPTHRLGRAWGRLVVQICLSGQRRDQLHPPLLARPTQLDDTVGRVAQKRQIRLGQPTTQQPSHKPSTPRKGLGPPLLLFVGLLRRSQLAQNRLADIRRKAEAGELVLLSEDNTASR